jgi:hypothetical protein
MRYTKPEILNNLKVTTEIQQTGTVDGAKALGQYLDCAIPPVSCTLSAYEADE